MRRALPLLLSCSFACGGGPERPRGPLGVLPTAVTSAEPLWIPFRVHAGRAVPRDPRETRFAELRRLTFDGSAGTAVWSDDGAALRYVSPAACRTIVQVDLGTGRTTQVEQPEAVVSLFAQGSHVATGCKPSAEARPASTEAASNVTQVIPPAPMALGPITNPEAFPTVSADGAWLAWQARDGAANDGPLHLWLATREGARARAVTRDGSRNEHASFTRDGKRLVYASDRDATTSGATLSLFLVEPDGPITSSGGPKVERVGWGAGSDRAPRFSPDGRWLAFLSNRGTSGSNAAREGFDLYVARWVE